MRITCCAGKLLPWDSRGASLPQLWQRCAGELGAAWESLAQLFAPALRRTTALLQLVWTADTFVYYGVVLLAATVRSLFLPRSTTLAIMQLLAQNRTLADGTQHHQAA